MKEPFVGEGGKAPVATVISTTLDEYTIRFNRPASASHGLLFYRLMEQAVCAAPTSHQGLVGGRDPSGAEGCLWRIDFSRARATLIASSGSATSMSFLRSFTCAWLVG
jgi:hypothetical protein